MSGLRERQEEQARRFAEFIERDPSPIFEADRDGRVTYENAAAKDRFPDLAATSRQHPLLVDWPHVLETLDREPMRSLLRVVPVGPAFYEEDLHLASDRQRVRVHAVETTARVRDEEIARRFEVIANRIPEFMTLIGRDYVYRAANEAYCRAHKLRREALIGKTVAQVWGEQIFQTVIQGHLDRCLAGEEVSHQLWIDFPTTGRRHVDVSYYPDRDASGEVQHAVVMTRDITRVLEQEELLRQRERREALGRLAEGVVRGMAHGSAMVEHLKTYFDRAEVPLQSFDVNEIMTRVADHVSEREAKGVRVSRELGSAPPARGIPEHFERALGILYSRALHAAQDAKGAAPRITLESWQEHGLVKAAVTDNGPGIPEGELQVIFEPAGGDFSLAAAKNLIEGMGGRVESHNAPGRGSQFVIALPLAAGTPLPVASGAPETTTKAQVEKALLRPSRRATIVVIDDDAAVGSMIRNTFSGDHEVITFLSGREALGYLERIPPVDIVFCDLMMPGMSGMDVFAAVSSRWPDVARRMVFLSGGISSPQAERFLAAHPVRRCGKPLGTASLQKLVQEFLAELG